MSLELRLTNVLRCLQQNNLSAAGFVSAILDSRYTAHAASQDSLTMNAAHICAQLYDNENSHTSVFSWAAGTLRRELCKEVAELSLEHHGLHFKATSATVEQLETTFMTLLDSREYRRRKMPHPAGHVPAPEDTPSQNEMDLGELGGDEPHFEDDDDGDEEDDGEFDKRPRKRQRRAGERNVALQHIKTIVIISICLQNTNERCNCLQGWMGFFMKSTGVPEKVIEVMAHAGLSVSLSTIYNMVTSISKEISRDIKREVRTLRAAFAYDNFDIAFNVAQPTLENRSSFVSATSATVIPLYGVDE
ncbi:uncharacterized protein F5147DRAFT_575834, partial [Suillus discolor]